METGIGAVVGFLFLVLLVTTLLRLKFPKTYEKLSKWFE